MGMNIRGKRRCLLWFQAPKYQAVVGQLRINYLFNSNPMKGYLKLLLKFLMYSRQIGQKAELS